jgi:hypothetical protein
MAVKWRDSGARRCWRFSKGRKVKKIYLLALLASVTGAAHATDESDRWFKNGLPWYEHPCGMEAFAKYGKVDTPDVRHNYYTTLQHPEQCSKLFP